MFSYIGIAHCCDDCTFSCFSRLSFFANDDCRKHYRFTKYDKSRLYATLDKAGVLDKIHFLSKQENSLMGQNVYQDAVDFSGGKKQKFPRFDFR